MKKNIKRKKVSLGNSILQSKIQEIPMPQELMEQLFDSSQRIGYESNEEFDLRNQKESYNKQVLRQIRKVKLTDRQRQVINLIYVDGLSLTATAEHLGVKIGTAQEIRDAALKNIRAKIKYNFQFCDELEKDV